MDFEIKVGDPAPDFRLLAVGGGYGSGQEISLAEFHGTPVVLYFYPKDDTPGCTAQAWGLRDSWKELRTKAKIFGVSADSVASHQMFINKRQLPFPLISDADHTLAKGYGVCVEKNRYGRKYMGIERSTFVVGANGRIAYILRRVKPEEHVILLKEALGM